MIRKNYLKSCLMPLAFILVLPFFCYSQQADSTNAIKEIGAKNILSVELIRIFLGNTPFGNGFLGYERKLTDKISLATHFGLGTINFVDINYILSLELKHFAHTKFPQANFFSASFNHANLKYQQQSGQINQLTFGLGYRWVKFNKLTIDICYQCLLSKNELIFEKQEEYISIGGSTTHGVCLKLGFLF